MDTVESKYGETQVVEIVPDQFLMLDDFNTDGIDPRIGEDYQAEIPALSIDATIDNVFGIEAAIPVTCVDYEGYQITNQKNLVQCADCSVEGGSMPYAVNEGYQEIAILDDNININFSSQHSLVAEGYDPLPGTLTTPWSEAESKAFLLGLYFFGKDLVLIRNFVESKKMGDILVYYYGTFYKSDAYSRWSKLRKVKSNSCIIKERIVKGFAQQELLSRVLPALPKEVQNILLEVSDMFNKGRTSLKEYLFTLKLKLGIDVLFDAIGIGKGDYDLTGISPNARKNQTTSFQLQLQIGKALCSLSSGDICKLLMSGLWRSKAKSNDLFWEVIWPRLLVRGWKSEKLVRSSESSYPFVFLVPGVKKFSRKELIKGIDYYDSISDILSIVERDPRLLDTEGEGIKLSISTNDGKGKAMEAKFDHNMSRSLHHFLHPGVAVCSSEDITIVDISMCVRNGLIKIRERFSLPYDSTKSCPNTTKTEIKKEGSKQQDSNGCSLDVDSTPFYSSCKGQEPDDLDGISQLPLCTPLDSDHTLLSTSLDNNISDSQCAIENLNTEDMKLQSRHHLKTSQKAHSAHSGKLRSLSTSNYEGTEQRAYSSPRHHQQKQDKSYQESSMFQETVEIASEPEFSQGKSWPIYPANGCIDDTAKCASSEVDPNSSVEIATLDSEPKGQFRSHPCCQLDANLRVANQTETNQKHDISQTTDISTQVSDSQQNFGVTLRKGTRNRSLTVKALEARACGLLGNKRKRRNSRTILPGTKAMRPASPARETIECSPQVNIATVNSDFGVNGVNDGSQQDNVLTESSSLHQLDPEREKDLLT